MIAGVPGTSISGIYYILLAFLMPANEAHRSIRGQSSLKRWQGVTMQSANAAGILATVFGTGWLLAHILKATAPSTALGAAAMQSSLVLSLAGASAAFAILGIVLLAVMAMSIVMPRRPRTMGRLP